MKIQKKDKNGNPVTIVIEHWEGFSSCIDFKVIKKATVNYILFKREVNNQVFCRTIGVNQMSGWGCERLKKEADEVLELYNTLLRNNEEKERVLSLIDKGCK